ncbi:MAG: T9SS type A sorting domain-containing protein [Aquaticitalea sp.]
MKKITFILFLLASVFQTTFAQVTFEGSNEYGILGNFVYDATVSNRVYASTTENHIMVSDDNGSNWNILFDTSVAPYFAPQVRQMRLANSGTALSFEVYYAAGSSLNNIAVLDLNSLTLLKQYFMPEMELGQNFNSYSIYDDGTFNTVFVSTNDSNDRAYYTTDGGVNWTKVFDAVDYESVLLNDATMDPNNPQKLFIARNGGPGNVDGSLMVSEDAGQTWSLTLEGLILQSVTVNPLDSDEIYVGTGVIWTYPEQNHALYHSVDGGATWEEETEITWTDSGLDNVTSIAINPYNTNHVLALGDDQIAVTMDAGVTWTTTQYSGPEYIQGNGVAFNPMNTDEVFISNLHYGYKSVNSGISLTKVDNPFHEVMGNMTVFNDGTDQHLLFGARYGYVDRNLTTQVETPIDVMPIDTFPFSGQIYQMRADGDYPGRTYSYSGGFSGNALEVSDDYGTTKNFIYSSFDVQFTAVDTDPSNDRIAWIATFNGANATLVKTDFTNINSPQTTYIMLPANDDFIYGLHINSDDSNNVMVTVGNQLYRTTDGGAIWNAITAGLEDLILPNITTSLVQNPLNANQFTMSASNGIYTSMDGGTTWTRIYDEFISEVKHSTETDGHMVGVGYSIYDILPKVIYSEDGGATWTTKTYDNYYSAIVTSSAITFTENSADVFLGTLSLGILKDTLNLNTLSTPEVGSNPNALSIYPNPTNGVINVVLSNGGIVQNMNVYNVAGQKLMEVSNTNKIDISNLSSGIYLLKMKDTKNNSITKQIIKN